MSENLLPDEWDRAYAAGLEAAREAVARLQHKPGASIANAVSAIDALRGSGNLDTPPSAEKGEKP